MHSRLLLVATVIVGLNPLIVFGAPATNLDQEYDQVRRIALRDPKVKAAFERANQRLEAKIVEIDPALKGWVRTTAPASSTALESAAIRKPAQPMAAPAHRGTHVIVTGDTLSSIAAQHQVPLAELKALNPNVDEKRLQVGESLKIPSRPRRLTKPQPVKASPGERWQSDR
ncbi:MAG: LysM domain [Chthoniobacter sp.]|jgi:LysM repeat protein|nr:LysM domain [Chthoniobacter sp.]